jgi:hypothetical protein
MFNNECITKPLVLNVILFMHVMNKGLIFVDFKNKFLLYDRSSFGIIFST